MADIFANDLFEIAGTHIQLSRIKDYRLGQIEFIMRPLYFETTKTKWGGIGKGLSKASIEFGRMEYYAAIIGEAKYKTAIEDSHTTNIYQDLIKTAAIGISEAFSRKGKRVRYRIMNPAWRVSVRSLQEIPALLCRRDGKMSEVYEKDELYPLLGEPIAPSIVMVPALYITSTDGNYVFYGNGIQVDDLPAEYERLKSAIQSIKELKEQQKFGNRLQKAISGRLPKPKIEIPFLKQSQKQKKLLEASESVEQPEGSEIVPPNE